MEDFKKLSAYPESQKTEQKAEEVKPIRVRVDKATYGCWYFTWLNYEFTVKDIGDRYSIYEHLDRPWLVGMTILKSDCTIITPKADAGKDVPPGIVDMRKDDKVTRFSMIADHTYESWYECFTALEYKPSRIRINDSDWSVGEEVIGGAPQNNRYTILAFKWGKHSDQLGWMIEVPMKGSTASILLSLVSKLPPPKQQPPRDLYDRTKDLEDRMFELEERVTANETNKDIYMEIFKENQKLKAQQPDLVDKERLEKYVLALAASFFDPCNSGRLVKMADELMKAVDERCKTEQK